MKIVSKMEIKYVILSILNTLILFPLEIFSITLFCLAKIKVFDLKIGHCEVDFFYIRFFLILTTKIVIFLVRLNFHIQNSKRCKH